MSVTRHTIAIEKIRSDKDTHFSGALAQNAIELENLSFPADWGTVGIQECVIEGITIQADQNLEWDVFIWATDGHSDTDLDLDKFIDFTNFATTDGKQIAGAGQYYYSSPSNLSIPYRDDDKTSELHVGLVNKSATAKNAGATGEVVVEFHVRPVYGV